jgi:hypothetical protein
MTPETLSATAAALLSLAFSYIPGLSAAYANYTKTRKRLVMLGLLALTALGAFALACLENGQAPVTQWLGLSLTCTESGAVALLRAFGAAVIANQSVYLISPKPDMPGTPPGPTPPSGTHTVQKHDPDSLYEIPRSPEPRPGYPGQPEGRVRYPECRPPDERDYADTHPKEGRPRG